MTKPILVFGSNEAGVHGAGAALAAYKRHGARFGKGYGHYGESFAIPTKDGRIQTLPIATIKAYIAGFCAYATGHPKLSFQVTRIGCGLAGLRDEYIAPLFADAPQNCEFDSVWKEYLPQHKSWGTF